MVSSGLGYAPRRGSGIGARTDLAWSHYVSIDGKARNVKYNYCEIVLTGGI